MPENWKKVGKVKEAHGLRGDLHILVFSKDISWAKDLTEITLTPPEQENQPQLLKIKKWKPYKQGLLLQLENYPDRTAVEKFKGHHFWIPENLLESTEGDTIFLSEIEGFEILNPEGFRLGKIVGFSSNNAQDLLVVEKSSGGQAEIPFVEDFIVELNFDSHHLKMNLPEGIWDLTAL
ncbi:MAG: ribosome maturation factor RimM [Pseudobdellovibrionaceae bacterium]